MSLLTGRKMRSTNPEPPKKAETAKPGEVYVTKEKVDFGVNARRNMTDEKTERMAKAGYIPEVDASGRPTGAYTVNRNKKPTREVDRKSTRLNSSHRCISYAVFCLKKKKSPIRKSS